MIDAVLFGLEDTLVLRSSYQQIVDQAINKLISCILGYHAMAAAELFTRMV
jgi:hypothetical protein